ncbi:MAG: peptidoglycan-binding domain-containing protein [Ilumatobacteraceae bacterium]
MTAYTTTLQTELHQVGYYDGPIDGIYGPLTVDAVKGLQADSDLPETGFVDRAAAAALDDRLADLDPQAAAADLTHTAAVQTVLTLAGSWHGPIDGWPLYLFAGDSAPGDSSGQGQGGVWYVLDPTGNAIDND